jgi:hypothetical protein
MVRVGGVPGGLGSEPLRQIAKAAEPLHLRLLVLHVFPSHTAVLRLSRSLSGIGAGDGLCCNILLRQVDTSARVEMKNPGLYKRLA